jgi:integrase/recombinase XerD
LLCYLRKVGAAPQPAPPELPAGPVEVLLEGFRGYLRAERGVSGKTAQDYAAAVRPLLDELADAERVRVEAATAEGVSEFILGQCRIRNVRVAQLMVTATRALLRYLHLHGMVDGCLVAAVPKVPDRRQQLPRGLEPAQVQAMLDACDHSPAGRRDYAILVVLARLGLRAGEAARLCLEDIDWQRGQLTVRGKPRRVDVLPLPVDVGQALAGYLRWGRPAEALTGRCSFGLWPRTAG